jgi:hypothetical protein
MKDIDEEMKSAVQRIVGIYSRCPRPKARYQVRYSFCRMFVLFILSVGILSAVLMMITLSLPRTEEMKDNGDGNTVEFLPSDLPNLTANYIYIDIGCYNAETIEHFIRFYSESQSAEMIVFEPEPTNYQLCQHRLQQAKYSDYRIKFLPKVVWTRNEKVAFQINRGRFSRMVSDPQRNYAIDERKKCLHFSL